MTSKEALEYILKLALNYTNRFSNQTGFRHYEAFEVIKKDLERLEEYEREVIITKDNNIRLVDRNIELSKQNEKLKQQVKDLENNQETVLTTLEIATNQIEKLKKAIKIINDNPLCIVDVIRFNNYFTYREMYDGVVELTKSDFDLLKELLGNDK